MLNEQKHEAVNLGDTTDHGGEIIRTGPEFVCRGVAVALDGHLVACPTCGGAFPVLATGPFLHHGVRLARRGDRTLCGATLIRG
ncbi:PAAR domain-containing protein [Paraburkholderia sediminicola]|nr:PAAR domain-containing protein [Paraburkholderia sediminicola]